MIKICPDISISDIEPVLLHTDVVPGNLILGDKGLRLIDWQCPAIGDPIVDIMMFLSPGMHEIYGSRKLSVKDYEIFLMSLTTILRNRYYVIGPLYHWRLAAYCFWKAEQGFIEYERKTEKNIPVYKNNEKGYINLISIDKNLVSYEGIYVKLVNFKSSTPFEKEDLLCEKLNKIIDINKTVFKEYEYSKLNNNFNFTNIVYI